MPWTLKYLYNQFENIIIIKNIMLYLNYKISPEKEKKI